MPSAGIETNRDSPVLRVVKHTPRSSLNRIFLVLSFHQFQQPAFSETIGEPTSVPVVIVDVQYGDFGAC
jgi:hypothetical protein